MGRTSDARERLIASAVELLHTRGYNGVGVAEICEHAGAKKGSFYYFFPSKRDLALAAIDAQWERYEREMLQPAFKDDVPPAKRIQRLFRMTRKYQECGRVNGQIRGCPFGNLALEMSTLDPAIQERLQEIYRRMASHFESALQEAAGERKLTKAALHKQAAGLLAYYQGAVLLAKTNNEPQLIEQLAGGAVRLASA